MIIVQSADVSRFCFVMQPIKMLYIHQKIRIKTYSTTKEARADPRNT